MQHKKYYGKYEFRDSLIRETVTNQNIFYNKLFWWKSSSLNRVFILFFFVTEWFYNSKTHFIQFQNEDIQEQSYIPKQRT